MMKHIQMIALVKIALLVANVSALACPEPIRLFPSEFITADIIIVGQVQRYEAIIDIAATARVRQILEKIPKMKARTKDHVSILYGRFNIDVEQVLKGTISARPDIYWAPATRGPAKSVPPGRYILGLVAMNDRVEHAKNLPHPPGALYVDEKSCAGAFIAEYSSDMGIKVRQLLNVRSQP